MRYRLLRLAFTLAFKGRPFYLTIMGILRSRWLRTGLVFFGILLLIYFFSNENGSSSISDHLNSENVRRRKSSPVIVRKKRLAHEKNEHAESKLKIILYWNKYFNHSHMGFGTGQEPFIKAGCKVSNCFATSDRSLLKESNGIIIHAGDYSENDLPTYRSPHQRFIFFNLETLPGMRHLPCFSRRHFYNWTMTYRRDSDIYDARPYGALRLKKDSEIMSQHQHATPKQNYTHINPDSRSKLIVWFNSHCSTHSRREDYVKKLAEFVPVDIYGKCGTLECLPRNTPRCDSRVLMKYKFYLAAENSLCPDYVTEKFYRGFINDVVPVVYGGADYSQYAPPHSYINIADFRSPKELADYLLLLDKNHALYRKYFDWKKNFEVINRPLNGWCDLCEKLNDPTQKNKSYENVAKWWYDDIPCLAGSSFINSIKNNM